MARFRVTVDWGDDRIRTYAVIAPDEETAEQSVLDRSRYLLTVAASDDWEDHPDVEPDDEWDMTQGAINDV